MALGILARKVGMTQLFVDDRAVGATVMEAAPCTVVQVKTAAADGYNALQLGYDEVAEKKVTRPLRGHFAKAGVAPHRRLFEVRIDDPSAFKVGDKVGVEVFAAGEKVDVTGTSRGKGFQGVMKRWHFHGGPKSHGSDFHRRVGSIGCSALPGRVVKGRKMPGHTGARQITVKSLKILRVDAERRLLLVEGSTPGTRGAVLHLRKCHG